MIPFDSKATYFIGGMVAMLLFCMAAILISSMLQNQHLDLGSRWVIRQQPCPVCRPDVLPNSTYVEDGYVYGVYE